MHSSWIDTGNEMAACMRAVKTEIVFSAVATETKINVCKSMCGWVALLPCSKLSPVYMASHEHAAYLKCTQ